MIYISVNLTVSLATAAKSISLWTKFTSQGCEMITLASWPPKTTFKNLDWILGWGDIGTNNWYFWFHKRIYVKNKPRISNVGRDLFFKNFFSTKMFKFSNFQPESPRLQMRRNTPNFLWLNTDSIRDLQVHLSAVALGSKIQVEWFKIICCGWVGLNRVSFLNGCDEPLN